MQAHHKSTFLCMIYIFLASQVYSMDQLKPLSSASFSCEHARSDNIDEKASINTAESNEKQVSGEIAHIIDINRNKKKKHKTISIDISNYDPHLYHETYQQCFYRLRETRPASYVDTSIHGALWLCSLYLCANSALRAFDDSATCNELFYPIVFNAISLPLSLAAFLYISIRTIASIEKWWPSRSSTYCFPH